LLLYGIKSNTPRSMSTAIWRRAWRPKTLYKKDTHKPFSPLQHAKTFTYHIPGEFDDLTKAAPTSRPTIASLPLHVYRKPLRVALRIPGPLD
jgi:hypothetical protein